MDRKPFFVFWFPGKDYLQSMVGVDQDGLVRAVLRSLSPFDGKAPIESYGRTLSGECVSVHNIVSLGMSNTIKHGPLSRLFVRNPASGRFLVL